MCSEDMRVYYVALNYTETTPQTATLHCTCRSIIMDDPRSAASSCPGSSSSPLPASDPLVGEMAGDSEDKQVTVRTSK
jgi:hypothetical protein